MNARRLLPGLLLVPVLLSLPASAQPFGAQGEFRVNTTTALDQTDPAVATFPSGNAFIITWSNLASSAGLSTAVHAQRFTRPANPLGPEFVVNTYNTGAQGHSSVQYDDGTGDFVIAWDSDGQDGDLKGIYARRYQSDGTPRTSGFLVNTHTTNTQFGPSVAADSCSSCGENFYIVWTDNGQIKKQDFSTGPYGGEVLVNSYTTGIQRNPQVTRDANFVNVVWEGYGLPADGDQFGIYAQRYQPVGTAIGAEFRVNTFTTGPQTHPALASTCCSFVVAWQSPLTGTRDVAGQVFYSAPETPAGSEFRVNTYTTGAQYNPKVAWDVAPSSYEFIVVWQSEQDPDGSFGIYAQRYRAFSFQPIGAEFRVNTYTTGKQVNPTVAFVSYVVDQSSDFVVTWQSQGQDGEGYALMAKTFCAQQTGDANGDGQITSADVFYLINRIFAGGPAPVFSVDVNADGQTNVNDAFFLINYLFAQGQSPACYSQLP